ncbi:MAG: hypothetical protein JWP97_4984 [Labilithrix sp.]|nr:hypothetical protein [Labilithrix sp.]
MRFFPLSRSAFVWTALRVMLAAAPAAAVACSAAEDTGTAADDVTSVENTNVKSQAIGNCWLYATAGWVESLHKGATARDIDVSEAYWNYWYWYEEISGGDISLDNPIGWDGIVQGGWWGVGAELIERYGWMYEGDFIPAADAKAKRHEVAVAAINASLSSGALANPAARRDPRIVRAELNKAWGLAPSTVEDLERQFPVLPAKAVASAPDAGDLDGGVPSSSALPDPPDHLVSITARAAGGSLGLTRIHAPQELEVIAADGTPTITLADAVGTKAPGTSVGDGQRAGAEAWTELHYDWAEGDTARRRALLKNLQHTLNQRLAVPLGWAVASNPKEGVYRGEGVSDYTLTGLHESILVDYEVEDVPGFGKLSVDVRETRPEALEASLDDAARITFFRIKNSWGTDPVWTPEEMRQYGISPDNDAGTAAKPNYLPSKPGYNDLSIDYIDTSTSWGGNVANSHLALRLALPKKLRFAVPAPGSAASDAGADAAVGSDGGSPADGGAGKKK